MSLIRAWLFGISVFIVMTASFVIAMSIAISGPPTDEEMGQAAAVVGEGMHRLASATGRLVVDTCEHLPEICGDEADRAPQSERATHADVPAPAAVEAPVETVVASVETPVALSSEPESPLLGASSSQADAAPVVQPRRAARAQPHRRAHVPARPHRGIPQRPGARRAPPLPALQVRVQEAASLPADAQPDIVDVTPTVEHVINRPAPSEDESAPQRDDPEASNDWDHEWVEDDPPADDRGYNDEAYYDRSGW